jgi:hypothetical protein
VVDRVVAVDAINCTWEQLRLVKTESMFGKAI